MKKTLLFRLLGMGCGILLVAGWIFAQDWPQWRGPGRDGKVSGFTAPQKWPETLAQKWTSTVGFGDATPALVADKLYAFVRQGDDEVAICLDAENGKELWQSKYAAQAVTGAAARHPGPRSSPAVADGKVVTLGVGGVLSCFDASTGEVVWRKDPFPKIVPTFFTGLSPIIVDGMAIVHLGGPDNGAVISYDLATGEEKWRWGEEGPGYASPAVLTVNGTKQIATLTEKNIVGIGVADGALLWKIPFVPGRRAYNAATPIIDGNIVIYTGAGRGTFAVEIVKQGEEFSVNERWHNPDIATQFNTPVLKEDLLFGLTQQGNFFCIDAETGQTAWLDEVQRDRSGFAAIVDVGAALLALPSSGEMVVIRPSREEYLELARIKVAETPTYAHPVISGNRIFIKSEETVVFWTIEK